MTGSPTPNPYRQREANSTITMAREAAWDRGFAAGRVSMLADVTALLQEPDVIDAAKNAYPVAFGLDTERDPIAASLTAVAAVLAARLGEAP